MRVVEEKAVAMAVIVVVLTVGVRVVTSVGAVKVGLRAEVAVESAVGLTAPVGTEESKEEVEMVEAVREEVVKAAAGAVVAMVAAALAAKVMAVVNEALQEVAAARAAAVTSMQDPDVPIASSAARATWVEETGGAVRAMLTEVGARAGVAKAGGALAADATAVEGMVAAGRVEAAREEGEKEWEGMVEVSTAA